MSSHSDGEIFDVAIRQLRDRIAALEADLVKLNNALRITSESNFRLKAENEALSKQYGDMNKYLVKLESQLMRAVGALDRAQEHLAHGVLQTTQYVKQLDGSVKHELVPTEQSKVLGIVSQALAEIKERP